MNTELMNLVEQMLHTVLMALVPVVVTAFLTIPMNLGGFPGEMHVALTAEPWHMT